MKTTTQRKKMFTGTLLAIALSIAANNIAKAQCAASFTTTTNGSTANFTNTSSGTNPNTYYYWNFGDGNWGYNQNEVHTYQYGGTYVVCLTISDSSNNCYSSFCDSVTVTGPSQPCNASFVYAEQGGNYYFSDNSTGGPFIGWYWSFGDGNFSTAQNPVHTYSLPGPFNVCLTVYSLNDTCTFCDSIYLCNIQASYTKNTSADPTVVFTNTSVGGYSPSYFWNFGDGNYAYTLNASHTYQYAGTYSACLTVSDSLSNCSSVFCDSVIIVNAPNTPCDSSFVAYPDSSNNGVSYFYATGNNNVAWYWNFGDNTTGTGPQQNHQYAQSGTYYVCLTVITQNGDSCTNCDSVNVQRVGSGIAENNAAQIQLVSYPNPFNGSTTISYSLLENSRVELAIYDIVGNKIATLEKSSKQSGKYEISWNASEFAAGTYFVRLQVNGLLAASKLTLIK